MSVALGACLVLDIVASDMIISSELLLAYSSGILLISLEIELYPELRRLSPFRVCLSNRSGHYCFRFLKLRSIAFHTSFNYMNRFGLGCDTFNHQSKKVRIDLQELTIEANKATRCLCSYPSCLKLRASEQERVNIYKQF